MMSDEKIFKNDLEIAFLRMFYLQKTCFRIKDKKVEKEDDIYF